MGNLVMADRGFSEVMESEAASADVKVFWFRSAAAAGQMIFGPRCADNNTLPVNGKTPSYQWKKGSQRPFQLKIQPLEKSNCELCLDLSCGNPRE